MVDTKIAMVQAWACYDRRLLTVVAGALSSQELQERVGAKYCIALLDRASGDENGWIMPGGVKEMHDKRDAPAMLRLPASPDGGDELVVPETENGVETSEWRQRAGATA
eukprot:2427732-Pleurochrysis_carterae.AAC.1